MRRKEMTCDEALRGIALGEPDVEAHLTRCPSCRQEALALGSIISALQAEPAAEVPARLDRSILLALAGRKQTALSRLSARVALALSATATIALSAGIAIMLANVRQPGLAILQGLAIVIAYIAISSVATLPIFTRVLRSNQEAGSWT